MIRSSSFVFDGVALPDEPVGHPAAVVALQQYGALFPSSANATMGLELAGHVCAKAVVDVGIKALHEGHLLAFARLFVAGNVKGARDIGCLFCWMFGGQFSALTSHGLVQAGQGVEPTKFAHAVPFFAHGAKIARPSAGNSVNCKLLHRLVMFTAIRTALLALVLSAFSGAVHAQCNDYDLMLLCDSADMVDLAVTSVGLDCAFSPNPSSCFYAAAVLELPTMSTGCISCFADQADCALSNCATICAFGSASACDECVSSNCEANFESCAGIVDADNDTHNNICDCDDNNPLQYSGAPGTNEGIDNNCNGLMEASEVLIETVACEGDFSGDTVVGAADLVIFLGTFGCIMDCGNTDMNGDGNVGAADLVIFLGFVGTFC